MSIIVDRQVAVDEQAATDLPSQDTLERWIARVLSSHDRQTSESESYDELTVRFVETSESQALNLAYRDKDKPTNVLSFPFEAPPGVTLGLLGDLVICHDVVAREADEQGKSLGHHYAHLVIHGCLHLLGYDHIDDAQAEQMESTERQLLAHFNIADPYRLETYSVDE